MKDVLVGCECGCTFLKIQKDEWDGKAEYTLSAYESSFSANQRGIFSELKKRIKAAWYMLTGKEFHLYELCLTEQSYKELIQAMLEIKNTEVK